LTALRRLSWLEKLQWNAPQKVVHVL